MLPTRQWPTLAQAPQGESREGPLSRKQRQLGQIKVKVLKKGVSLLCAFPFWSTKPIQLQTYHLKRSIFQFPLRLYNSWSPMHANMLSIFLEIIGYHVIVEHGAKGAIAQAQQKNFDACLLDIGLPEMDGNNLARCLRTRPGTSRSMLIAVTGYGQQL